MSSDGGETWTKQTDNADVCQRSWYFTKFSAIQKWEQGLRT